MLSFRSDILASFRSSSDPGEKLMRHLSNLGYTVKDVLSLLNTLKIMNPQLLLNRSFRKILG